MAYLYVIMRGGKNQRKSKKKVYKNEHRTCTGVLLQFI